MAKLVHAETGADIILPQILETRDGEKVKIIGFILPQSYNSTGRVIAEMKNGFTMQYFPSVVNAKIVDFCPSCRMESDDFEPNPDPDSMFNTVCGACGWTLNDPRNPPATGENS